MIKKFIISIMRRAIFGYRASSDSYIHYLRENGIHIGEGTIIFDAPNTVIDSQNPKILNIGNNVRITSGCVILTHDFSWSVIGGVYGECVGGVAPVVIGNNVFLGMNSTILKGSSIGDNVIIGAGSLVSGKCESNSVYVGNPARRLCSLEEFYKKSASKSEREIAEIMTYIKKEDIGTIWKYLREYSCYFKDAPDEMKKQIMMDTGYPETCKRYYGKNPPEYALDDFMAKG